MKYISMIIPLFLCMSCKQDNSSKIKISYGSASDMTSSVVPLIIESGGVMKGNCTGSIIKEKGYILLLTATHCVEKADRVLIADSRLPSESMGRWRARVALNPKKSILVDMKGNPKFKTANNPLDQSQYDFALGLIKEERADPVMYKRFFDNALEIGYEVDINPKSLSGKINYIGVGIDNNPSDMGILREGQYNISPKKSESSKTLIVDSCWGILPCTRTRQGDSGSPLLYKDPKTNKKKVIGVLYGGRTNSESLYTNLAGNRFPNKIEDMVKDLWCKTSN